MIMEKIADEILAGPGGIDGSRNLMLKVLERCKSAVLGNEGL